LVHDNPTVARGAVGPSTSTTGVYIDAPGSLKYHIRAARILSLCLHM